MIDLNAIRAAAEAADLDALSWNQAVDYLNSVPVKTVIALCDEIEWLRKILTPLSDEQIKQATGATDDYWASSKLFIKAVFQAAEQAHGITGGAE